MGIRDKLKGGVNKVGGGVKKVRGKLKGSSSEPAQQPAAASSAEEKYYEQLIKESQKKEALFNAGPAKRKILRGSIMLIPVFILLIVIGSFLYISSVSHGGLFSYSFETYYGPIFGQIGSFISPITSLVSSDISCISNVIACTSPTPTAAVNNTYPSFTSFLAFTPESPVPTFYIENVSSFYNELFYTVKNNANVPLGSSYPNNILMSLSCGPGSKDPRSHVCFQTVNNNTFPGGINSPSYFLPFISTVLPSDSIINETNVHLECPVSDTTLAKELPVESQLYMDFDITNFTAVTLLPLEFINSTFNSQIYSSELKPTVQSTNFVTPGPIQVSALVNVPQPVLSGSSSIPINIELKNHGSGAFVLNSLLVFYSARFGDASSLNPQWSCAQADGGRAGNFVLPNASYYACSASVSTGQNFVFVLPNKPIASHFDTFPLIAAANYGYQENYTAPFFVRNQTGCTT